MNHDEVEIPEIDSDDEDSIQKVFQKKTSQRLRAGPPTPSSDS